MSLHFRQFEHLVPRGSPFRFVIPGEQQLRQFFEALATLPQSVRDAVDQVWLDNLPQKTRELDQYEDMFDLTPGMLTEQERRDRLEARFADPGGQSPSYIQNRLQDAGFDVFVFDWWELPRTDPPTVINPNTILASGASGYNATAGSDEAHAGRPEAFDGQFGLITSRPLVNIIYESVTKYVATAGSDEAHAGRPEAFDGSITYELQRKLYDIPTDPDKWRHFIYVGGETFPDLADVPSTRQAEFEKLLLSICPTEKWIGVLVRYV